MRKELYYFRDQQGLEVDFLIPRPNAKLWLVEAKAAKTVRPSMASPLTSLQRALQKRSGKPVVIHGTSLSQVADDSDRPRGGSLRCREVCPETDTYQID